MIFRVMVVDDEPLARLGITARLQSHPDMTVVGECSTGEETIDSIPRLAPDLIFLDIQMPGISGLEVLRSLSRDKTPCILFLTAHENYAIEAFEVEALDYLLKPIDDARFAASLDRARRVLTFRQQETSRAPFGAAPEQLPRGAAKRFVVRKGNDVTFVPIADVDYFEGLGDYVGLHVAGKTHLVRESLTSLEARLDRTQFLRIHRSTIIQIDRIVRVEPVANRDYLVTLRDRSSVRASRTYSKLLKDILQNKSG